MLAAWGVTSPWPGGITDDGHVLRDGEAAACAATWLSGAQGGPCWRLGGVPKVAATRLERASWRQVWPAGGVSSDDGSGRAVHAAGTAHHPARSGPAGAMALRVALAVLAALAFAPQPVQSGATGAPNILFLLTDGAHHRARRAPARVPRAVCRCWPCMQALQRRLRCRCSAPGTDPEQLSSVHSARALGRAAATRAHI